MAIARPIENLEEFKKWRDSRPPQVQQMIDKYPPDRLYRINSGHRVTIYSYMEDGTVVVNVTGEFNRVLFSRHVAGIPASELVECALPLRGEDVGDSSQEAGMTPEQARAILVPAVRDDMIKKMEAAGETDSDHYRHLKAAQARDGLRSCKCLPSATLLRAKNRCQDFNTILDEISFCGLPEDRNAKLGELKDTVEEVKEALDDDGEF